MQLSKLPQFFLFGLVFLIITSLIWIFKYSCPTKVQELYMYSFWSVSFCLMFWWDARKVKILIGGVKLGGGLAFTIFIFRYDPINRFKGYGCKERYDVTVFVHGTGGYADLPLKNKGYVVIESEGEPRRREIGEYGEAVFRNLPLGEAVHLHIDYSEQYDGIPNDSDYIINDGGKIYYTVKLHDANYVTGHVRYADQPLNGVAVSIKGIQTKTDSVGYYRLEVPDSLQSGDYEVWFQKVGFKVQQLVAHPQQGDLNVLMEILRKGR